MNASAPAGLRTGIQETAEIIAALAGIFTAIADARADDGKVSRLEALGMVRLAPAIYRALRGLAAAGQELRDLSPEELDALAGTFLDSGGDALIPHDALLRDRLDVLFRAAHSLLRGVREWENLTNPPKALPL